MLRVFGSGFVEKGTNHFGLRRYVLDTKFGPRYDVTHLLVLTRIRQDVSAGKCVAALPRQDTPCSPNVISFSAASANLLHRVRMLWILENACDSWFWNVPKIQGLAAQSGPWRSQNRKRTLFLAGDVDSRDAHRIARKCAGTGGRCSVSGQKHVHPERFRVTLKVFILT